MPCQSIFAISAPTPVAGRVCTDVAQFCGNEPRRPPCRTETRAANNSIVRGNGQIPQALAEIVICSAVSGVMAICANQNCSAKSIKRSLPQYTFPK